MWRNYLLTALRNHLRQSGYTLISLAGLMLGMAVATLSFLHVWQETHYDRHLPDAKRLYVAETQLTKPGRADQLLLTSPGPLAPESRNIAGVEESTRMWVAWYTLSVDDRLEFNHPLAAVEPNFPTLMGIEMIEGSREALLDPSAAMVSESMAERLFGEGPYLGQTLTLDGNRDFEVAGVYEDMPQSSHLDTKLFINMTASVVLNRGTQFDTNWNQTNVYTYLRLSEGTDATAVGKGLQTLARANMKAPDGMEIEQAVALTLEPVTALHLNGKPYVQTPTNVSGNPTTLAIALAVALLVLIVACINSINIATARSADRAHEVGLRKVVGASRSQLIVQFLGESAVLVLLATVGALVIAEIAAGPVGDFVGRDLSLGLLLQPAALATFVLLVIGVVLLSGLYPAFVLASFKPAKIFAPASSSGGLSLRAVLVVFQFVTSIALIVMAGTIWQQVNYLQSANLGFDRDDIVLLPGVRRGPAGTISLTRKLDQAIETKPGIVHVSGTHSSPSWDYADEGRVRPVAAPRESALTVDRLAVDTDFFDVIKIAPVAGRVFDEEYGPDRAQWDLAARKDVELPLVLNAAAVSELGMTSPIDAVGEAMSFELEPGLERAGRIVGVVPDFHFKSLKAKIRPMVFFPDPARFNVMMVRIDGTQRDEAIASIQKGWNEVLPNQAISISYLDRDLVDQYVSEQRQFAVLAGLAGIAIFIAMLGLVGLLAHAVAARRREISMRKVLGAEVGDVLRLFLWQFSRPVVIAALIAWPVAWLLGERWLSGFAYRIDLSWVLFAVSGVLALGITWALTAAQVLKISRSRPADVLQVR